VTAPTRGDFPSPPIEEELISMRTHVARLAVIGTAVLTAVVLAATTALAATTFTVKPGGAYLGKAGKTTLTDNQTGSQLTCKSSTAKGKLKSGSGLSGAGIGTVTGTTFNKCTGPLHLSFTVKQVGTWALNVTKYSSKTGVSTGYISKIESKLTGTDCKATVKGEVDVTYTNKTGVLAVKPVKGSGHVLKISGVNGCAGLIANGNTSGFVGNYKVSPKQKIS
jgi:hypothetical protein